MQLEGKAALITGGAARIGKQIALKLASQKMRVIIHYNQSRNDALTTCNEIGSIGADAWPVFADLRSKQSVDEMESAVLERYDQIDLLINNAAVYYKTPLEKLSIEDWDHIMDVNLRGAFLCSIGIGKRMKAQGSGRIINIADWSFDRPYADYLPYCVSKAGVVSLTKALAKTLAPEVQVNCISPGAILMQEGLPAEVCEKAKEHTLVKRLGEPSDIAEAVLYLASCSEFITGANIMIDGGRLLYGA